MVTYTYELTLKIPDMRKKKLTLRDVPSHDEAKKQATQWARNTLTLARKHIPQFRWGHWYDAVPPEAPDSMYEAFQPIGDGNLTLECQGGSK